jgi:hypothetical protein
LLVHPFWPAMMDFLSAFFVHIRAWTMRFLDFVWELVEMQNKAPCLWLLLERGWLTFVCDS